MTGTDSRLDNAAITLKALENSNTNIDLDFAARSLASKNDLDGPYTSKDVTYRFDHNDPNLEQAYLLFRKIFDDNKISNLKDTGLNGDTDVKSYTDEPAWVADEAQYAVDDITAMMIRDIHLDPDINYENYPVPSDLIDAARDDQVKYQVREKFSGRSKKILDECKKYFCGPEKIEKATSRDGIFLTGGWKLA